jgi:hypothetical protein
MVKKSLCTLLLATILLSACVQKNAVDNQEAVQLDPEKESVDLFETSIPVEATDATSTAEDDPISSLKGKIVKDKEGYYLVLGFVYTPDAMINYGFPESYQYPHTHIKEDIRLLDGNGTAVEFNEVDPGELNMYVENPLGEGIIDPRVLHILQSEIVEPLTLEMVNLVQEVNLAEQSDMAFTVLFDAGFPVEKDQWTIDQTVELIPEHPFTLKYFDATYFNDYNQGKYDGPQNSFFSGSFYLEAAGFEGITLTQIVPEERQAELPEGWGGSEEACSEMFDHCVKSDAGLLKTNDNIYNLQISAYSLILHGPWHVQFDLPE